MEDETEQTQPSQEADKPKRVLLGVGATPACYRGAYVARLLRQQGFAVTALLASGAERYVSRLTFEALTDAVEDAVEADPYTHYPHLTPAEAMVVAPLDAATLARLALGLADDSLTTAALAHRGPLVVAPSLPKPLLEAPAVVAHREALAERGAVFVSAQDDGPDRMAEPSAVLAATLKALEGRVG